ncbi:transglycosylase SLT domain-containing protein [Ectothiorhodospira lacustris]|uniref:transglycosylase SLT domain-containing protein n=1 Tax=Ectothiorhodospira lacustris TaxID=2899127 RepID=UPI001EE8952B|nr:transglycosylase SLT domain-containing protein [Ectothiorhodospira lacustris]MCG5509859.1 transglycosylase SLT domain-containing protein [Ectothiorhodospira lacustris]MCG5521112.1 transglycosylase SLT domain-containing protein [Ectothiorhodospira lacustris]
MSSRRLAGYLLPLLILLPGLLAAAPATGTDAQRERFLQTERALQQGNRTAFQQGIRELQDYALLPYLIHADLNARFPRIEPGELDRFLERWGDSHLGHRLRTRWLTHLAGQGRWEDYLRHYQGGLGATHTCQYHNALLRAGRRDQALDGVETLWLVGRSQVSECDPVFNAWREAGGLTSQLAWERFRLAMEAGQPGLARYLRRYMPEGDRIWADRWLSLYEDPTGLTRIQWRADAHPGARDAIVHSFNRLARRDPREALTLWESDRRDWGMAREDAYETRRFIALRLTLREKQGALPHLATLPDAVFDDLLRQWQLRAALAKGDWETVAKAVTHMSGEARQEAAWRYWHARALEQLGDQRGARTLYDGVSEERNFYGFLAADRLERPYRIGHRPLDVTPDRMARVAQDPALARSLEMLALGRIIDARREWMHLQNRLQQRDRGDLEALALIAGQVGWHDRAIFAAARAQRFDDIDLRFPLAHAPLIMEKATVQGINPAWAMAVARQESAFMQDARSHAGAMGLMQIMPDTGRAMAPHVGATVSNPMQLLDPDLNVSIGTYYLRRNLDNFGGHPMLSTAAYNAGAGRVRSWLPRDAEVPADVWAELIPFSETRDYVRRVLAYKILYEVRLGMSPTTLSSILPPVTPAARLSQSQVQHQARWSGANGGRTAVNDYCDAPGYTDTPCL